MIYATEGSVNNTAEFIARLAKSAEAISDFSDCFVGAEFTLSEGEVRLLAMT